MRVLIFHGYLLEGTGSNVYNARLAAALVALGHDVHLLSQDRHPDRQPFVNAVGDWDGAELRLQRLARSRERGRGSCTVYRPNIGGLLPVYVADRYEEIEARTFAQCSEREVARYIDANVVAVGELLELVRPDVALANHVVMGPVILARALEGKVPYAVKVHGSALEYTVKPQPERFLAFAREGLAGASGVLVGSHHTAASLWDALGEDELRGRTRLGPPGVDVTRFRPLDPQPGAASLRALAKRLRAEHATGGPGAGGGPNAGGANAADDPSASTDANAFARDAAAAGAALERLDPDRDVLVAYVGKLIVSKGVDLLIAAWPLVLERVPRARLVVVGFGAYRDGLERLCRALLAGDLDEARAIALAGSSAEGGSMPRRPLRRVLAFLDGLAGEEREGYLVAARALDEQVVFTGRLQHDELPDLLPACAAVVVPSTFPEAFGMVAAEAAACGAFPISAAHSGLAEVSSALANAIPEHAGAWLSFAIDERAVRTLARNLVGWLRAEAQVRSETRAGLVKAVRTRWSWEGVARGVIAAAQGELDRLAVP